MAKLDDLIQQKQQRDEDWKAKKTAEREELGQLSDDAVMRVTSEPGAYLHYLDTQAINPRYSASNVMSKQKNNGMMKPDKWKRRYWTAVGAAVLCLCCTTPAMAAGGDPLDIVNNLSDFIFSIIKALGVIILGWGIVQVGMSIQSHDASQRTQGFLCLFGGLMIAFAKEILTAIGAI